MTLISIKRSIDQGKKVYWKNEGYQVIKDILGQYLIVYKYNNDCVELCSKIYFNNDLNCGTINKDFFTKN